MWWLPKCQMPGEVNDEMYSFTLPTEAQNIWTPHITHANAKDNPYPFQM